MSLKGLALGYQYRPDTNNIVDDFYTPCLKESVVYRRAVGYFTSGSLALAARGLISFVQGKGVMQLIASPVLTAEDIESIKSGYEARDDVIARAALRCLADSSDALVQKRLSYLAWLIAEGRLEIKLALVKDLCRQGIYHEKIGVFSDLEGNIVAFSGSSNETEGGLYSNFECIEAYCSWRSGDYVRVENKCRDFENLWSNSTNGLDIVDFPAAGKRGLLSYRQHSRGQERDPEAGETVDSSKSHPGSIALPAEIHLRQYQMDAVKEWFRHNGSGIFEMATGTGKTMTALVAAQKLYETLGRIGVIIVAPMMHLCDQWAGEAHGFGFAPVLAYKSRRQWVDQVSNAITAFRIGGSDHYCIVTTNATLASSSMRQILEHAPNPSLFIGDEVHHLGALFTRRAMPPEVKYRLGLSATPGRWYDEDGTSAVNTFFNPGVVYEFGLKKAISEGFLTRYYYYPHIVTLNEEENEQYLSISQQIARLIHATGAGFDDPRLQGLLIRRTRLLSGAAGKLPALRDLVADTRDISHALFYCGDIKVSGSRHVDLVVKLLGCELGVRVHPFTNREDAKKRRQVLEEFACGKLQGLAAIRCLDEGVDVPATSSAYILASSANPREFIQRRGRILRRSPGKQHAVIHDFIVSPRNVSEIGGLEPEVFNVERRLFRRELDRVAEFCESAENGPQALAELLPLRIRYNLLA